MYSVVLKYCVQMDARSCISHNFRCMRYDLKCGLSGRIVCTARMVVLAKSISPAPDAECLLEYDARIGPKEYFASDVTSDAGCFDRQARLGESLACCLDVADSHRGAKMAMKG